MKKDYDFHIRITGDVRNRLELLQKQEGYKTLSELGSVILSEATKDIRPDSDTVPEADAESEEKYVLKTTVTPSEKEQIKSKAKKCNLSTSAFIRKAALSQPVIVLEHFKEFARELSRIGNNLNQLTVLAHMKEITSVNLEQTNETLKRLLNEVISLKESVSRETKGRGG